MPAGPKKTYSKKLCAACNRSARRDASELYCAACRLDVLLRLHKSGYLQAIPPETPLTSPPRGSRNAGE